MSQIRNWSDLREELLRIIAEKLMFIANFARFGGVCRSWRDVTLDKRHFSSILTSPPWLMLTAEEDQLDRGFYSLSENKTYRLNLPEARGCHCWGSPYGWLITLDADYQMYLLNPVSHARLPLPPSSAFEESPFPDRLVHRREYIYKAVMFPDSTHNIGSDQYVVFLILSRSRKSAFARPGDTKWTTIMNIPNPQTDILQLDGRLYSVDFYGSIWCLDITVPVPMGTEFASRPDDDIVTGEDDFAMVELQGQFYMCVRIFHDLRGWDSGPVEGRHRIKTVYVELHKLDLSTRQWKEVSNMGDYAIFIGSNTTISVKATDYPGCKPNCIYFTDHQEVQAYGRLIGHDMGIFNQENMKVEPFYEGEEILSRYSPPVWITPTLQ